MGVRARDGARVSKAVSRAEDDPLRPGRKLKRYKGTILWFDYAKARGLIGREEAEDVTVLISAFRGPRPRTLAVGQRVEFEIVRSLAGLRAIDVVLC